MNTPQEIVAAMLKRDQFSQWLDLKIEHLKAGECIATIKIRPEMLNGFSVAHGGITYSFADSVLAFASNSHGRVSLAIENNISYTRKVNLGDILKASAKEISCTNRIATYNIDVCNQNDQIVAIFRGTVFRTEENH